MNINPKTTREPHEIRAVLVLARVRQSDLARELGVSDNMISRVIRGQSVSGRVRRRIAEVIGRDVKEIWPDNGHKRLVKV